MAPPASCTAMSWPGPLAVSRAKRPCRGRVPRAARPCRGLVSRHSPASSPPAYHNTLQFIAIQGRVSCSSWSRYTQCIVTQCLSQANPCLSQYTTVYCDTTLIHSSPSVTIQNLYRDTAYQPTNLQYTSPKLPHVAIQFPAHYTSKGHVTIQFSIVS